MPSTAHNRIGGSELFVVGVFFNESKTSKQFFFKLWTDEVARDSQEKKVTESSAHSIDAMNLLPKTDKWFRYEGSLTTKPYSELVSWLVLVEPLGILSEDLQKLQKHAHQPERGIQPLNRRFVIRNLS